MKNYSLAKKRFDPNARNRYAIPVLLGAIKFILPFILQDSFYDLHRDEYLYLAEAHHLDWGFMEVPPLLSIFAKLTQLLENSFFWVKFWPSLFGALTVIVVCDMVTEMGGRVFAQCVAAFCLIGGVYLRINFLFQPNFLEVFWWSLLALFIIKHINTGRPLYLILIGIAIGLAWLSKYSIVFFVIAMIVGMLLTSNRKVLLNKYFYLAVLIAGCIALPNIIWQYNHKWPVVYHMKELRETQLQFVPPSAFLRDQVLMHFPYFFIWIGGLIWLLFFKAGRRFMILGWMFLAVIILLIASSGKNYYSIGAYPMLFAAGGTWLERITTTRFAWLRYVSGAVMLGLFIPFIPLLLPVWEPAELSRYYTRYGFDKTAALRWEDLENHALPQDFADMTGWKELAEKVAIAYAQLPDSIKTKTLLYCRNYGQAGAISYFEQGLPQVNTDNASFLFWMPEAYNIRSILLVADSMPGKDEPVFQQFGKQRVIDSINNPYSREYRTKIYLLQNANEKANPMLKANIKKQKDLFRR